jgi:hypothetical protein
VVDSGIVPDCFTYDVQGNVIDGISSVAFPDGRGSVSDFVHDAESNLVMHIRPGKPARGPSPGTGGRPLARVGPTRAERGRI